MIQYKSENITVFQSALFQTTSTVIETEDTVLIVDPTWLPDEVGNISNYINSIRDHRPIYLAFTHSDYDHIIGYKAFSGVITIGSEQLDQSTDKENVVEKIKAFDDDYYLTRDYEVEYPNIDFIVKHDNQVLKEGETVITFYRAPGHTDDGIFIVVEPIGVMIVGDYLSNIEFPFIYHNSVEYENTLLKLDEILNKHKIKLLIPGHGLITGDLSEIRNRQQQSLKYIKNLRNAIIRNSQEEIDELIQGCLFPRFMQKCHVDNINVIKKELHGSKP